GGVAAATWRAFAAASSFDTARAAVAAAAGGSLSTAIGAAAGSGEATGCATGSGDGTVGGAGCSSVTGADPLVPTSRPISTPRISSSGAMIIASLVNGIARGWRGCGWVSQAAFGAVGCGVVLGGRGDGVRWP